MSVRLAAGQAQVDIEGHHLALHNLDKPFWPQLGLTKGDLVNYYVEMAPSVLPHLRGRPFVMKPFPNGADGRSYYRWALPGDAPAWLHRWRYRARTEARTIDMLVVEGLPELVWAANRACIELHPWLSRTDDVEHPDLLLFDLDPGPEAGFPACLEVAGWLQRALERSGVRSYAKTTGGDGMHVLVPLERRYTFRETRGWVRAVAEGLAAAEPDRLTTVKSREARRGRVLVDYAQNGLGKSYAAPYSVRATAGATVSAPLTREEVAAGRVRPDDFTMMTMPARVKALGDLFAPLQAGQTLPPPEVVGV